MKLTHLQPSWKRYEERDGHIYYVEVDKIEDCHGIMFLCPKCFKANDGPIGTHSVICWSSSRGTPAHATPLPGRWRLVGSSFDDLTLKGETSRGRSIGLMGGCNWHGFITNGEVTEA